MTQLAAALWLEGMKEAKVELRRLLKVASSQW